MVGSLEIKLKDRLDRIYKLNGFDGQSFRHFLLSNYIPASSVILKVNGAVTDDQKYVIKTNDDIDLTMVRAYQLPEYCQMLELWDKEVADVSDMSSLYTNKVLWFKNSGVCELKQSHISAAEFPYWLENKFVDSICSEQLLNEKDHFCLPLSGGRDSLALLYLLERTKARLPNFSVIGVTVASTVASIDDLNVARDAIRNLGIKDYHILDANFVRETMNLKADFFSMMDKALKSQGRGLTISLWHGVLKACIERFCRERNLTKIAYGYQFEDLIASLLRSNLLGMLFGESMQKKRIRSRGRGGRRFNPVNSSENSIIYL